MTPTDLFPPPAWAFVPDGLDAGRLDQLLPLFDQLAGRPLPDAPAIERWLIDESELASRIAAEQARRYIRMTRHTDDAAARQAYLDWERTVVPAVKVRSDALDRKLLATPALGALDSGRYSVLLRRRRTQSELFRAENTELQRQEAELQTQQQALVGGIAVEFDGRALTLQQLGPYLERQERDLREGAFRAGLAARQAHWEALEGIYEQMIALRTAMARNAGFPTYTPYRFAELGRYDYDEATCRRFHEAIAECVVPAVRRLDRQRAARLGLDRLRPWDLEVDPDGRAPLRPFTTQAELVALCRRIVGAVDPRFAAELDELARRDLLDLMSRKGKAPGGYQYQLEDERVPFLFVNAVGVHQDVQTLLHECGHAFHSLLCRHHDLLAFRDYPIEIAETASMSMELLGLEQLGVVYGADDARRAYRRHLEGLLRTLTWIASIDAFQLWIHERPRHGRDERRTAWLDIRRRFGGDVDWQGLGEAPAMQWIAQSHLFTHPLYYVEYGIAQVAALQVWRNYRRAPGDAVAAYRQALALGGSRPLPELFAAAGVEFDLSPRMVGGLVDEVLQHLG
ncbi:MAG: M3 family oligoendopeptidase [Planctomycetes bacterium]|nr:M3 family oligoendopeptidase [Planctomycetota bacterium]